MSVLIPPDHSDCLTGEYSNYCRMMGTLQNEPNVDEPRSPEQQVNGQYSMILQQKSSFDEKNGRDQEDSPDDDSISSLSERSEFISPANELHATPAPPRNPPLENYPSEDGSRKRKRNDFIPAEKGTLTTIYCTLHMRPLTKLIRRRELAEVVHDAVYGNKEIEEKCPELIQEIREESNCFGAFPYRTLESVKTFAYNPFCKDYVKQSAKLIGGVWVFSVCVRND